MIGWRTLPQTRRLFAPIALRLVDDFTAGRPLERIRVELDLQAGPDWTATERGPVYTSSGIVAFPGLGRTLDPAAASTQRYRVRITDPTERALYRPAYRHASDGLEFDVAPWNDEMPPAEAPIEPEQVFLWPGVNYPFPSSIPLLRGRAVDASERPLADTRIGTANDHVLTDDRGAFVLPIRLSAPATDVLVVAEHARTGATTSATVPLPDGLAVNWELQLT
jgi:hypothetical protein